jgi:hypothetical protein
LQLTLERRSSTTDALLQQTLFYNKHSMDPCSPNGPGDNLYKQNTGLLKLPGKIHVDSMYPWQPPIIQNGDLHADSLLPRVRLSMILSLAMVYFSEERQQKLKLTLKPSPKTVHYYSCCATHRYLKSSANADTLTVIIPRLYPRSSTFIRSRCC